jgi:hypothetical protein
MERINAQSSDFQKLAKKVLSWITYTKRPLSILELQYALATEINNYQFDRENLREIEDIVSVYTGLVIVNHRSNIIRLVHYTTQKYFERTQIQ